MNIAFVGFLSLIFIGMTLLNRILEGNFILGSDLAVVNQLTVFSNLNIFGFISIPVPNLDFIITGIPRLIKFDYSFFGGSAGFFQYALYSLTAAMSFGLFIMIAVNIASSYLNRTR
jgi:hypothetical protein